jgi:hypothetical protein
MAAASLPTILRPAAKSSAGAAALTSAVPMQAA